MLDVFGDQIPVLFDSRSITDVMPVLLAKRIHFKPISTSWGITATYGNYVAVL